MIHTDEDDEFARIERENNLKGQPYHWDVYVSPSQRNQVLEECAKVCDDLWQDDKTAYDCREAIRAMKT